MSKKKQGGKLKQQKRPQPKYLGVKVSDGQNVKLGSILVRQRGAKFEAGENVRMGRDHTLYSVVGGKVKFLNRERKKAISVLT